jgi:hypothetical protein
MSKASDEVLAERQRQVDAEGWTPEHDDQHHAGELTQAAMAYAQSSFEPSEHYDDYAFWWPEGWEPMKRKPPRESLIKAAALLIAEIERIDRS